MSPRRTITVPWDLRADVGAGDIVAEITKRLGVKPCGACEERRRKMNEALGLRGKKPRPCSGCGGR